MYLLALFIIMFFACDKVLNVKFFDLHIYMYVTFLLVLEISNVSKQIISFYMFKIYFT